MLSAAMSRAQRPTDSTMAAFIKRMVISSPKGGPATATASRTGANTRTVVSLLGCRRGVLQTNHRFDIGHRHGEPHAATLQRFGPGQLVQVERIDVVDREPLATPHIAYVARALRAVPAFSFTQDFGCEHRLKAVRTHFKGGNLGEVGRVHGGRDGGAEAL